MSVTTKTTLPIIVELVHFINGDTVSRKELFNMIAIMNDYGPGSGYVFYKEESRLHYSLASAHLGGFNGMVQRLIGNGQGDTPLNAIQKALFFAAFPNSAKKKLSAFKTPNEVLNWLKNSPQEVMEAAEFELWPITKDVKRSRAAQLLTSAELRQWDIDETIPARFSKKQVTEKVHEVITPKSCAEMVAAIARDAALAGTYATATASMTGVTFIDPSTIQINDNVAT